MILKNLVEHSSAQNASQLLISEQEVLDTLAGYQVPFEKKWGRGKAYSLQKLLEWMRLGECRLIPEDGRLRLWIEVAVVTIRSTKPSDPKNDHFTGRLLVELREQRKNERGEWVLRPWDGSMGEKIRTAQGETDIEAIVRGIGEELGKTEPRVRDRQVLLPYLRHRFPHLEQRSFQEAEFFPGLAVTHNRHLIEYEMPEEFFHEQYLHSANGQSVRFVWMPY